MRLSDLTYQRGEHMGDVAYLFTINQRYTGYTRDRQLFHVLDHNSLSYADYSAAQLDAALQSGYFEGGNQQQPVTRNYQTYPNQQIFVPDSDSWGPKEYLFVGLSVLALGYLAWEASR